jgi:hypothetical protein
VDVGIVLCINYLIPLFYLSCVYDKVTSCKKLRLYNVNAAFLVKKIGLNGNEKDEI